MDTLFLADATYGSMDVHSNERPMISDFAAGRPFARNQPLEIEQPAVGQL